MAYPKSGFSYFFRIIGYLYGFRYHAKRDILSARKFKQRGRLSKSNIGHATNSKTIYLDFFSFNLFKFIIHEGEELTAEHFFLNRSISDLKFLLSNSMGYFRTNKSSVIFDPACGTGRHLQFLADQLRCEGIGVDIYQPAITVAKRVNIGKSIKLYTGSSLDFKFIESILPSKVDIVLINSWLGYVKDDERFDSFIDQILKISCFIMIISSINDDLYSIFKNTEFLVDKKIDNTQYVLIKGFKEVL